MYFTTKLVSFEIVTDYGNTNININAYTAFHLDVTTVKHDANEIKNQYQHLKDILFCDINDGNIGLLIGINYSDLLIHRDFRVGDPGDPIAVKTVLGWMLVGGSKLITKNSISCNSLLNTTLESLNQNVKQFWQIDSYGTVPESQLISSNEKRSLELLEKTTKFVNGHFQVGLLWKNDFPILQNNRELAIQRFKSLEKRFSKNPEFFNMYKSQINDYITSGQAKLLSPEEKNNTSSITNYITPSWSIKCKQARSCPCRF